jgi:class 3 adenylate cyclase
VTAVAEYNLCLDKYYACTSKLYSENQFEIEIERQDGLIEDDEQLDNLHDAIKVLFDYEESIDSKYKNARKLIGDGIDDMPRRFAIMFDIVKYSLKPSVNQKNNIQLLSRSLKKAVKSIFRTDERSVYLPTGDGMILILDKFANEIPELCYEVQKIVKNKNEGLIGEDKVEFRIGIHAGDVFKYSDINESLNFAGEGINTVERVTAIGDSWHILATENFYDYFINLTGRRDDFHDIGKYSVKHGRELKVYNVYNDECGNQSTPVKT